MSEIIVISEDDDLEEGEIADDIVPEPVEQNDYKPKERKLPRRYILHENKDLNSKHTKHRKHTSHHRKHRKSCPHRSLERHKFVVKQLGHKKSNSSQSDHRENPNSHTSSISTIKSAFKNFSSPRREPVASINNSNNQLLAKNVNSFQQILNEKTSKELIGKDENFNSMDIQKEEHSLPKCATESLNEQKLNLLPTKPSSHELVEPDISSGMMVDEESEDEEELRRIALSACLKRPVTDLKHVPDEPVASFCNENNVNITDQNSCNQILDTVSKNCDIYSSDNYEIVDMELDDDSLTEDVNSSDLFVIDRNPLISESLETLPGSNINLNHNIDLSSEVNDQSLENKLHLPSIQCQSNDDFEEELLRAEVIASMNSAQQKSKKIPEKQLPPLKKESQTQIHLPLTNKVQAAPNLKVVNPLPTYCKLPTPNFLTTHKRVVNKAKSNYSKLNSHKTVVLPPQRIINACPERLVITLNNDSSTEDSDEECDKNKDIQENVAVASIEALISDARQRSDIQKNNSNSVSCLSKAQQEEYKQLKKILAQNQLPKRSTTINDKRTSQLKMLAKNISVANDNLSKERKLLSDVEKELLTKKKEYMASKLKAQHLKEQLHAAELVRAANLESWKKSAAKLDIQKKSVSKHEAVVDLLKKKLNPKSQPQVRNSILSPIQRNNSLAT